ncbi:MULTISPECIES: NAD(P)/FAD-dependent oxidoreductase [unclassified Lentimonas]|uniref:dihydrolipoyl dehydrogenase family protein n=1 Tax=unclassified Lentimonas TaxID=2630993 RepID=UPI0013206C0B|nr:MULTISPECIES: NAD(P)/FAD-dependent oxidoreductase [unclassified Lentimonas]CAA6679058.1 Mercuric ion reductase (EC [Lentimonas sp. CC4]CAA6684202.1 Mercuric ion reductase (EC [Lentimonas sp. CC6]CAA7076425.1 Mercuric ion reductase (EC [Lentimonas sp. CC4]CAA7170361.1 Mercuric ion reductase (EC [Lentimonas sp. CC21]CAA7182865.1 Mercuric ion reductase (EC [Lentimonas sp. CC8]
MKTQHFDYIVIGGGSGGYAAARTARETLNNVAIIDNAPELGGLCILRGCMPSKTLIYSAEVLHLAQKGKAFGLNIPEATVDMPGLHQRKLETIKEFSEYREGQLQSDRFTLFRSRAKFINSRTIQLTDGTRLTADHFMVATGSVVSVPPVRGLAEAPCWTSDDVLDLDFKPEKVIVLGGGIVACELAQFMRRIGTEVIQIQRSPHILKEVSSEAATVIEQAFRDEGIQLYTGTALKSVQHSNGSFTVTFEHEGKQVSVNAPHLLNALGRRPATDGLGLTAAGIKTLPSGHINCNAMQLTSNPRVYACGDVAGPHEIVHVAIMQGETAAKHATGRPAERVDYDSLCGVVFTDPQIGVVGLSEKQLKERGIDYLSADYPFDDHGKSILMEAKYGYVKVLADKSGVVLGAECVSKDAGELIHAMAVAVTLKANVRDLMKVHWYHPTLAEIWSYPIEDIVDEL